MLWSLLFIFLIALCNAQDVTEVRGTTSQSTDYKDKGVKYTSDRAMDGNLSTCAHTLKGNNSWWRIDLLGVYRISSISISNVNQHNADIEGAKIYIGNSCKNHSTTNSMYMEIKEFLKAQWNNFTCTNMSGRYITVSFPKKNHLILCEVKIFGTIKESRFKLFKKKKNWEDALEYCREKKMNLASIVNEETQVQAELEAKNATTPFVWLGLRYTCTLEFWFWTSDKPLEFSRWGKDGEKKECDMSVAMDKKEDYRWYTKSDSEMYNFICED